MYKKSWYVQQLWSAHISFTVSNISTKMLYVFQRPCKKPYILELEEKTWTVQFSQSGFWINCTDLIVFVITVDLRLCSVHSVVPR